MSRPAKDGYSRRDHYEAAGIPFEDWGIPDPPLLLLHVWEWFCDLAERRKPGVDRPNPLEWGEMARYFDLMGERPTRFEIKALCAIDRIAIQK